MLSWEFESSQSDSWEGLNTQAIAEFKQNRVRSIAREFIQNSLDAVDDPDRPVEVRFRTSGELDFGRAGLLETFVRCLDAVADKDEQGNDRKFFASGVSKLESKDEISSLIVEDFNTTGLTGLHLDYLTRYDAMSHKGRSGTLGSRGTGKYAAFAASPLHTVLYSSLFTNEHGDEVRVFQGKAMLASHYVDSADGSKRLMRRTGFYGCSGFRPLTENASRRSDIPATLVRSIQGTSVAVVGFEAKDGWERELLNCVVTNFYFAVLEGRLRVEVADMSGEARVINQGNVFELVAEFSNGEVDDPQIVATQRSLQCVTTRSDRIRIREPDGVLDLDQLGKIDVWVKLDEGQSSRVDVIRSPGMFICNGVGAIAYLKRLPQWWERFSAVVVSRSDEGNDLLRMIEPADHSSLNPSLVDDLEDRKAADAAIGRLGRSLRGFIEELMPSRNDLDDAPIDWLAHYFPDESLPGAGESNEADPFGGVTASGINEPLPLLSRRSYRRGRRDEDDDGNDDAALEDSPSGQGDGDGGVRPRPKRKRPVRERIEVTDLRYIRERDRRIRAFFTAARSTRCRLRLRYASEEPDRSDSIEIEKVQLGDGSLADDNLVELKEGERHEFLLTTVLPVPDGRALVLDPVTD